MTQHEKHIRLIHMLEAAEKSVNIAKGKTRLDLDSDEIFALAATRLLEILGEAANHVPDEIKRTYPQIPWHEIIGVRNRLIHGYFDVDWDIIWQILSKDLPEVMPEIRKMVEGGHVE